MKLDVGRCHLLLQDGGVGAGPSILTEPSLWSCCYSGKRFWRKLPDRFSVVPGVSILSCGFNMDFYMSSTVRTITPTY